MYNHAKQPRETSHNLTFTQTKFLLTLKITGKKQREGKKVYVKPEILQRHLSGCVINHTPTAASPSLFVFLYLAIGQI